MPEYLAPGVYVEEVPSGNMPIQAASTSTAGMVGVCARGPANTPTLVTSLGAYNRIFGGRLNPLAFNGIDGLPYAAEGFFQNGGSRLYVVRVVGDGAREANLPVRVVNASTTTGAAAATDTTVTLADVTGITAGDPLTLRGQVLTIDTGGAALADPVPVNAVAADVAAGTVLTAADGTTYTVSAGGVSANDTTVGLDDITGLADGDTLTLPDQTARVTGIAGNDVTIDPQLTHAVGNGATAEVEVIALEVMARWPGVWGNDLRCSIAPSPIVDTTLTIGAAAGDTQITVTTAFGLFAGSVISVGGERCTIVDVDTTAGTVDLADPLIGTYAIGDACVSQEFSLVVQRMENGQVAEEEVFDRLSLTTGHPRFAPDIVGSWDAGRGRPSASGGSNIIRLTDATNAAFRTMLMAQAQNIHLTGGDDDAATILDATFVGTASDDPDARTGIQALMNEPALSLVAVPGQTALQVQNALLIHCNQMVYRFAVLDTPIGADVAAARTHRQNYDDTRGAVYYPALRIPDAFGNPGDEREIAPSGHVLGVYARTDVARGVHKVAAIEVIRGISGFEKRLGKGEQDILNPINLNCFRDLRSEGLGMRIYGGRVATSNPEFRYINVRRLMLMVEQSLDTGLQWAVFEPNSKPTWDAVKQSVSGFLNTVWRNGALEGVTPEEAYFVNIGYDVTMTQDDINNGRMIIEVGIAPVKPAEFVILRISQKTREATS